MKAYWGVGLQIHVVLTLALFGGGLLQAPAALRPVSIGLVGGWEHEPVWTIT
jgi:hypothetical protein